MKINEIKLQNARAQVNKTVGIVEGCLDTIRIHGVGNGLNE